MAKRFNSSFVFRTKVIIATTFITFCFSQGALANVLPEETILNASSLSDTTQTATSASSDEMAINLQVSDYNDDDDSYEATDQVKKHYWPSFALKTNLLFDLASALNVEVEIPIARHWSVAAEWMFPWWIFGGNQYCFQVLSANLEARYWFNQSRSRSTYSRRDRMLGGFFMGLYAGGGLYDLQWDLTGYQGEFYIASGLSLGYSVNVGDACNIEFSVGAGYMVTDYRHYIMKDNYSILAYQYDGQYTWIGPTRAKVSLVWLIGQNKYSRRKK